MTTPMLLSVIVPMADHEPLPLPMLQQLFALGTNTEIILAHSRPRHIELPPDWPRTRILRQCSSLAGRARQLNAGARIAAGRWLWFLHADSRLTPRTLPALLRFIAREQPALGYFDLRYLRDGPSLVRLNAWCANRRARWFGLPFGDQGFCVPLERFASLGGYDETLTAGEDHRFVRQAHAGRLPVLRIGATLETSARRYAQQGWLRTTVRNVWLTVAQSRSATQELPRP